MERPAFLDQEPPKGYIPGIGRGATGFTTRSDIGSGKVPARLRDGGEINVAAHEDKELIDSDGNKLPTNSRFDDSNGLSLASEVLDRDDEEAENIYLQVDNKLSQRNRRKKEIEQSSSNAGVFGSISEDFVDLKRSLAGVSEEQWEGIPEAGDITRRNKRQRLEMQSERKTYAAPDTLISGNINLTKLTEEREKLLGIQLDENFQAGHNLQKTNNGDAVEQYLSQLDTAASSSDLSNQVEDLKKMRIIFSSYRKSDPKKPQGWIASARLEEKAQKFKSAKQFIEEGCKQCPRDEDIWLENIRLHSSDIHYCKVLVAEALRFNNQSLKLWLKAVDLERESFNKVRVVRKALQNLPSSESLWKLAVQLESNKEEALRILTKAVELNSTSVDLVEALINLQNHAEARKTLNRARQNMPTEERICIFALEIEEKFNNASVDKLIKMHTKGIKELSKHGKYLTFENWLTIGENLEREFSALYPKTVEAIIYSSLRLEYDSSKFSDLYSLLSGIEDTCWITKVSAYSCILKQEPGKFSLWKSFIALCRNLLKMSRVYDLFNDILFSDDDAMLKKYPILVLIYSKEVWKIEKNEGQALEIIDKALRRFPPHVDFWLAKTKLLIVNSMLDQAEVVFHDAMQSIDQAQGLERLYYRYISFLRFKGDNKRALTLLEEKYLQEYPECEKLYLQWGQIYSDLNQFRKSRECFSIGTKKIPRSCHLWKALSELDEQALQKHTLARSDLDLGLLKNPDSEQLFFAKIQMETRLGNYDIARLLVSESLRKFPESPLLWAENIKLTSKKSLKRTVFQDALKATNNDGRVLLEIGINFFRDAQYEKSLKWLERATTSNPLYGDAWLWLARCNKKLGKSIEPLLNQVEDYEPRYGNEWISMSKNVKRQYLSPAQILKASIEALN